MIVNHFCSFGNHSKVTERAALIPMMEIDRSSLALPYTVILR
jgi:hypothetical protein